MPTEEFRPIHLLLGLGKSDIRWLMIGRRALIHYGAPMQTYDYDFWVDPDPRNASRFLKVAEGLDLQPVDGSWEVRGRPLVTLCYREEFKFDVFLVRTFKNLDGVVVGFDSAYRRRAVMEAKGDPLRIPVPSLEDLKLLKRMRDSEKDREDLRYLDLLQKRAKPR